MLQTKYLITIFLLISVLTSLGQQNDTLPNGYTFYYYPNNRISSEGVIQDNKPNGYWKTYYPDGVIKTEGNRQNFELEGEWIFYDGEGDTTEIINYRKGKKNGYYSKFKYEKDDDGVKSGGLISRELFVKDTRENKSYYFEDGYLRYEFKFKNGRKHGLGKEFNSEGRIITYYQHRNDVIIKKVKINRYDDQGLKQGQWINYHPNDRVHIEANYLNDKLHGYYKEYDIKGQLKKNIRYFNGEIRETNLKAIPDIEIKNEYYSNGKLKSSGGYRDTVPVGKHKGFDENSETMFSTNYDDYGNVISKGVVNDDGKKDGKWEFYYPSGELKSAGKYKNGRKSGKWTFYFIEGGIEQKGNYKSGRYNGEWTWYYDTGEVKRVEHYSQGKEDGFCTEYLRNGDKIEYGEYVLGLKEGEWVNNVGGHYEQGIYKDGLKEGDWKYYYSDEKLKFEGSFIQGQEDGKHKWYFENGNLEEERFYVFGSREKNWKKYNEDGTLFMTISFRNDKEYKINGKKIDDQKQKEEK